ncbi:hypothetical protein GGX14DRAFT_566962 [Mycena pura]|uniref:Uncharacterized protein n=1 Tax=Mycena pura TaxID=153505 RepID=A0AAD6YC03_9AGAR|nr:hypothetical protein GGX14DRAFT_566962 [Mycena pura]
MPAPGSPPFDWGVPNVSVPLPSSRNSIPATPRPLPELTFDPVSVYDVRRHLGAGVPLFNRLRHRYSAADLAFLASGASEDSNHLVQPDEFFPEYWHLYDSQPAGTPGQVARREFADRCRRLLCDVATKYDRATAGTTFIVHVNGTMVPNSPLVPERLKAHVYLPPHFLAHHPEVTPAVAFLVQMVIEQIGIPTARDWRTKAQKVWNLTQTGRVVPVTLPRMLVPSPINPRSSQYLFPGRPWNQLAAPTAVPGPTLPGLEPFDEEDLVIFDIDQVTDMATAVARMKAAEAENKELRETIESLQALNAQMQLDFQDRERSLNEELEMMTTSVFLFRLPPTPSRRRAPPTYVASPTTPALYGLTSPRRGIASAPLNTALTDDFLEFHALSSLRDAVILILRHISSVHWKDELAQLNNMPADLVEGLANAMDEDVHDL